MLKEARHPAQIPGDPPRRVFGSAQLELIVWDSQSGDVEHFQLGYDLMERPRVLEFKSGLLHHYLVDRGPDLYTHIDRAGFLTPLAQIDRDFIATTFAQASAELPAKIRNSVEHALTQLPGA